MKKDILIIGGGAAGIMAAITAADEANVLLVERDVRLGGILNICIHDGFGLYFFKEELTGPEFADRLLKKLEKQNIEILLETTVIKIKKTEKGFKAVLTNEDGLKFKSRYRDSARNSAAGKNNHYLFLIPIYYLKCHYYIEKKALLLYN